MGVKKFIELVTETLGMDEMKKVSKKKSVKRLLKKDDIEKALKAKVNKKKKKELNEEMDIITFQIKKGEAILKKLNS